MPAEEMIVLANSLKLSGRCVAGVSTETGQWIRPVSEWEHGELYPGEFRIGGREPQPLDVVRFSYSRPVPVAAQPENVLIEGGRWELVRRIEPEEAYAELEPFLSSGPEIFGDCEAGVAEDEANAGLDSSLALVEADGSVNFVVRPRFAPGKQLRTRAVFDLSSRAYDLPVTDGKLKPKMLSCDVGTYEGGDMGIAANGRTLLTISLGQPFNKMNWKLVAGCFGVG
jgi:hypothetical protein